MNAALLLQPGDVWITLTPDVVSDIVRNWMRGRYLGLAYTREQLETLAEAIDPGWRGRPCPDCGGPAHDGDEVDR